VQPSYISLYQSGELKKRAEALEARLHDCDLCPRKCGVNRLEGEMGFCHSGAWPIVDSVCPHHGEEPPLSGTKGSGTVFFGNCNMRCIYCQNYQISQDKKHLRGYETDCKSLAERMLYLQDVYGCHNINFVSPSHFVPQMVRAILEAVSLGLKVPLVYNTGGYDSVETLSLLGGIIDIYLPDIRYADNLAARKYSRAPHYVEYSRAAIKEMFKQVGNLVTDEKGVAERGLIVRHLILPGNLAGSTSSLNWLANEISRDVHISLMAQYYPAHRARHFPALSRRITKDEYETVLEVLDRTGLENGWIQSLDSPDSYRPDFKRDGHPFESD
jgi:putative pyruvate formate lyase activating enzyme